MNHRLFPPASGPFLNIIANGRPYTGVPGTPQSVLDCDAAILEANGWNYVAPSGPSSSRPTQAQGLYPLQPGVKYFDETLAIMIQYDGAHWRGVESGTIV